MSKRPLTSIAVRSDLVHALNLDLVGPSEGSEHEREVLPQAPSRWYLTGFLAPIGGSLEQRSDDSAEEQTAEELERGTAAQDDASVDSAAARKAPFPSSIGISVLVPPGVHTLDATVRWGDYEPGTQERAWQRIPRKASVKLTVPEEGAQAPDLPVPGSGGLVLVVVSRSMTALAGPVQTVPAGTRAVAVFLVNRRPLPGDEQREQAFAFQAELELHCPKGFVPRPDPRGAESEDPDDRIADLQYRGDCEFAVGHGVATEAELGESCLCTTVRTCWIPSAEVERVAPASIPGVELGMEALAELHDVAAARQALGPLVESYRRWIGAQAAGITGLPKPRRDVADELLVRAKAAADRIEAGIELLGRDDVLKAFRIANKVMAIAARKRFGPLAGKDPATVSAPGWRPFQLAFVLMNLRGIAEPEHHDRAVVDLLFFPTGGGKTEAYLGLAAFTLVLRRLRYPGLASAGVTVLMRYTLRLLTLDQLTRAATLICALELEREQDTETLGPWPFEIGLWVGRGATPNHMGAKGDDSEETARSKTRRFKEGRSKASPIPIESCPWCGTKLTANSFNLLPNPDHPMDLRVTCANRSCEFTRNRALPILAVDEPIYRRLPCFLLATVDKLAGMPWFGPVGKFFGSVERADLKTGFYGPCDQAVGSKLPVALLPPELIIQDELHLISGPLGTMVGLYEAALDELCTRHVGDTAIRPKIVASTATVRRAQAQVQALFDRRFVDIFPPPGPDRRDSFFAATLASSESPARLYVGVAAQGRSLKVVLLRAYLALMGAAQRAYDADGGKKNHANAADPYMTLVGYFNSLRELGGSRRIVEDEVRTRLQGYGGRMRVGEKQGLFADREITFEPVELTSRESTAKVSQARRRLGLEFWEQEHVDVAIATNMISVGLDILRLGLMVVLGQPKTTAEYIQATSRVGRDEARPGLVVTLLNVHRPRDRSHYERFAAYHETFYRGVEVTSVTPFSPRALDRGLAGTVVSLARQGHLPMTPPEGASAIATERAQLARVATVIADRASRHARMTPAEATALRDRVRQRVVDLLDAWEGIAHEYSQVGVTLQYQEREVGGAKPLLHDLLDPQLATLPPRNRKFRAPRSMRDVEPNVNLHMRILEEGHGTDGVAVEAPAEEVES